MSYRVLLIPSYLLQFIALAPTGFCYYLTETNQPNGRIKMNALKVKTKISCNTCGGALNRSKTIKVTSENKEGAITEASIKIANWKASLRGQNCNVCKSIIDDLAA